MQTVAQRVQNNLARVVQSRRLHKYVVADEVTKDHHKGTLMIKFLLGLVIGLVLGGWLGINIGKDQNLFDDPFGPRGPGAETSVMEDLGNAASKLMPQSKPEAK